jgi:hypothetical protein
MRLLLLLLQLTRLQQPRHLLLWRSNRASAAEVRMRQTCPKALYQTLQSLQQLLLLLPLPLQALRRRRPSSACLLRRRPRSLCERRDRGRHGGRLRLRLRLRENCSFKLDREDMPFSSRVRDEAREKIGAHFPHDVFLSVCVRCNSALELSSSFSLLCLP